LTSLADNHIADAPKRQGSDLGIVLAGPIIGVFNYHWLFRFPLVAVIAATVAAIFYVPESPVKSPGKVDWAGAGLLSSWLVLLLLGITQTSEWGWGDPRVIGLLAAALAMLAVWIRFGARALAASACLLAALASLLVPGRSGRARALVGLPATASD
jgi:hypothetical protein